MVFLKTILKTCLVFIVFTVIGQIRVGEHTLENRYHRYVNSESFQSGFERLARPVTWTVGRAQEAIEKVRAKAQAR